MITALFDASIGDMSVADLIEEQQHLHVGRRYATCEADVRAIKYKLAAVRRELFDRLFARHLRAHKKIKNGKTKTRISRVSEGIVFA